MDASRFDLLTKRVATATSRRTLLRCLGGTLIAAVVIPLGVAQTVQAQSEIQRIAACTDFCTMVSENIGVPQTRSACADACRACAGDVEPVCLADADSQEVVCCPDRAPCSTVCGDLPGGVPPSAA